jgi:hypothetical protein
MSLLVMKTTLKAEERATAVKKTRLTAKATIWVTIGP